MRTGGPRADTAEQPLCGVYYAVVTQNQDERKLGRVKVRFPWLPGGDQDQSAWAKVAVPMAGAEFGTFTLPEVDDTVLVVFIAGDIRHPVVIGGAWNQTDTSPEANENGKNDFRFVKSRSGHRLLFDDSSSTKVVLTDRTNGNHVGCGNFAEGGDSPNKLEIAVPKPINGSPSKGVGVASLEGTVNVWCPNGKLTVSAQHVELTARDKAEIKAGGDAAFEGGMQGKVCSAGEGKFQGGKVKIGP